MATIPDYIIKRKTIDDIGNAIKAAKGITSELDFKFFNEALLSNTLQYEIPEVENTSLTPHISIYSDYYSVTREELVELADTIRALGNTQDNMLGSEIADKILNLPGTRTALLKLSQTANDDSLYYVYGSKNVSQDQVPEVLVIPNSYKGKPVIGLSDGLYYLSSVKGIIVPEGIRWLSKGAFNDCPDLEWIVLPKSLKTIHENAFPDSSKLTTIYYRGTPSDWANISIGASNHWITSANAQRHYYSLEHIQREPMKPLAADDPDGDGYWNFKDYSPTVLQHNFNSNITPATCTDGGYTTSTCSDCDFTYKHTYTAAKGHFYEASADGYTVIQPTCTTQGYTIKACGRCDFKLMTDYINALGHSWQDATCQAPKTCDVCGVTEGDIGTHSYLLATCTKPMTCSVCGQTNGTALGHRDSLYKTLDEPTCTEEGWGRYECSRCSEQYEKAIPATGHTFGDVAYTWTEPYEENCMAKRTCSVCGYEESAHASSINANKADCKYIYTATFNKSWATTQTLAVDAHDWEFQYSTRTPTCVTTGEAYYECKSCGQAKYENIPSLGGHIWQSATCTEPPCCSRCGEYDYEGELAAHDWQDPVFTWGDDFQSCTATRECADCNATKMAGSNTIESTVEKTPNCIEDGKMKYIATNFINEDGHAVDWVTVVEAIDTIKKLGHNYDIEYIWDGYESCTATRTCTRDPSHQEKAYATVTHVETYPEICTGAGLNTHTATFSESWAETQVKTEIADRYSEHIYEGIGGDTVVEPTCTEAGYTIKTCARCGHTEKTTTSAALGHEWQDATCTTPKTCARCNITEGDALGHNYLAATCVTPETCSICGDTRGEPTGIHTWIPASCTTPKTCSICKQTEGSALGHRYILDSILLAPTCTTAGHGRYKCTRCTGTTSLLEQEIPATGHNWNEPTYAWNGVDYCTATSTCLNDSTHTRTSVATYGDDTIGKSIITPATCTTDGEAIYTADFPDEWAGSTTTTGTIAAPGHNWNMDKVTYKWTGNTKCVATIKCKTDSSHTEEIEAIITSKVTSEPTCTRHGTRTYTATFPLHERLEAQTTAKIIPKLEHIWVASTGTTPRTCSLCGTTANYVTVELGKKYNVVAPGGTVDLTGTWSIGSTESDSGEFNIFGISTGTNFVFESTIRSSTSAVAGKYDVILDTSIKDVVLQEALSNIPLASRYKANMILTDATSATEISEAPQQTCTINIDVDSYSDLTINYLGSTGFQTITAPAGVTTTFEPVCGSSILITDPEGSMWISLVDYVQANGNIYTYMAPSESGTYTWTVDRS